MARELGSRLTLKVTPLPVMGRARFRIHRVSCPKCGRIFWFTLFSERSPEEVEMAVQANEQRLLDEPCDRHADGAKRTA